MGAGQRPGQLLGVFSHFRPESRRTRAQSRGSVTREGSVAAGSALRAAVLLRGGVPAAKVWRVLGEEPGAPPQLVGIAERVSEGCENSRALASCAEPEWRVLAAAWALAQQSGAPVALMLERIADALVELERLRERRSVLLAGPRATIRLVGALPIVALLMGALLGFDPLAVLLSLAGAVIATVGGVLLLLGVYWAKTLTDRLASAEWVSGLECELCWIALYGGASQQRALRRVVDAIDQFGVSWVKLSSMRSEGTVHGVLRVATAHGTPAGPMLLAEANAARVRTLTGLEREAERLAVRVLLPIGVCVLPSFIVLGVLPVLFAVMGSLGPLA